MCMPALVMLLLLCIVFPSRRRCKVVASPTILFWRSGGGVFLPVGSAIIFDRGFGHLWRRKAA